MPEGNEIHRWAERHTTAFAGKALRAEGPQGRFADIAAIDRRKLRTVRAHGKHLGYDFGKDRIVHVHLGLRGDFTDGTGPLLPVRGALRLRLWNEAAVQKPLAKGVSLKHSWYSEDDGTNDISAKKLAWVELRGPADCTLYSEADWQNLMARLGPDPLNSDAPEKMVAAVKKSKRPIGELLMDQTVAAGIGNIYRAELLFRARLNPYTPGREVPEAALRNLWADALPLMRAGMVDRRIVTTEAEHRVSAQQNAPKDEAHYVYRKNGQPCVICGTKVTKVEMALRNLFYCQKCQSSSL